MSLAILSAPDTHGVNLRAHGERPREVGHRESRAWLAAPQKALLFELCATAVVLLAVSIDLLKQDVMRLAQWANQECPAVGYSLAE
jgi:hypothetical protein